MRTNPSVKGESDIPDIGGCEGARKRRKAWKIQN
jgi:hypothetical protein